ncbi:MAG: histone deacetylase family protein [Chloroflexi bacterium]|nr:histone deacetylase family protein [Chloroflexota bacterium]MCL5273812.1 histone deacetylase family protein [Chloroflexota bacterium]
MLIVSSDHHLQHHPELEFFEGELKRYHDTPERASIVLAALREAGVGPIIPPQDYGLTPILALHSPDYVDYLQHAYQRWVADGGIAAGVYPDSFPVRRMSRRPAKLSALAGFYAFDLTAIIAAGTWEAAYYAAQCALTAAHRVRDGAGAAFALCRPPGHHAHADLCGGYCFLNNAAIAANWLASAGSVSLKEDAALASHPPTQRIAMFDIDFHHGNGSQDLFYERSDVLFVSIHGDPDRQYPYYLGAATETGSGEGVGYTVNYPLDAGITDDRYLQVLRLAIERIARHQPEFLVVSLGVDTFAGDPFGDFQLTAAAYPRIGAEIAQLNLPTVFIMEGGYAIEQLGRNVAGVLIGFQTK